MEPIAVMINGIPGNMAVKVAVHATADPRFRVLPHALTGPDITQAEHPVGSRTIRLIRPDVRDRVIRSILQSEGPFIAVDYTHPSAVFSNAQFYCEHRLPFVMGTTGGDRNLLEETVRRSATSAVIAPNMAKQIVGFQAMMEYAASSFPGLFKGYAIAVRESHQKGKADTSGTARAMIGYFNRLGLAVSEADILMERNPERQRDRLGVPEAYLKGHAWHTYTLDSEDGTVRFEFTHNVNGRDIYAKGTLDAIVYLHRKLQEGAGGRVFTMIDVLKDT